MSDNSWGYHTKAVISFTINRQFKQTRGDLGGFEVDGAAIEFWSVVVLMVESDGGWRSGFFLGIVFNAECAIRVL